MKQDNDSSYILSDDEELFRKEIQSGELRVVEISAELYSTLMESLLPVERWRQQIYDGTGRGGLILWIPPRKRLVFVVKQ